MRKIILILFLLWGIGYMTQTAYCAEKSKVLILTERGGQHEAFVKAALSWLKDYGRKNNLELTTINDTKPINAEYLADYKLFIQLNYPPYNWTDEAKVAFEQGMINGTIGWIGFHHASLLGEFDGFPMWKWASRFLGDITYKNYIAPTCDGTVEVERKDHPVMKDVDPSFVLPKDEWYIYDRSPRKNVSVLAHVNEESYSISTDIRMGDHPVVWTNYKMKARNVYFQFGHDAALLKDKNFTQMFSNAIQWAMGPAQWFPRCRALVVYNPGVEEAHQRFAKDAMDYFRDLSIGDGIIFDFTSNFDDIDYELLRTYDMLISLDDNPGKTEKQRQSFEKYMENGGGWLGFHSAAFNIPETNWPWFTQFMGGIYFNRNSWPPLPAKLRNEATEHPLMKGMPECYIAPENEWYQWEPSPRRDKDVVILLSLDDSNYPMGLKDELPKGLDTPVAWTNTRYNMVYLNWGHGGRIFNSATQNYMVYSAIRWIARKKYEKP